MILIDAIYINNGGGKVLLDYIVTELEKTNLDIVYLFDDRVKSKYIIKNTNSYLYLNASFLIRYNFYKKNINNFSKIFILGNIPPPLKLPKSLVYTYFHNYIYIKVPKEFSLIDRLKYFFKIQLIKYISSNTNYWLLQSETIKNDFIIKFGQSNKIMIIPFYSSLSKNEYEYNVMRKPNVFLYISNAQANKNHIRLIEAFCLAYDCLKSGKLILTVSKDFPTVLSLISKKQKQGYPIENIGYVEQDILIDIYSKSQYIIFPSVSESFGLGIIEGIELGCKAICADLPYSYAVCSPSATFNPYSVKSIQSIIIEAMTTELPPSKLKIKNEFTRIQELLTN